ncbi:MAG: hypothetical protein AVO35_12140 [Candidatus Aegiribacteria sp. MLS_C]|nr:MAG: hypothetical protein AVO35_12140 [Candidatus Aegiribacteria sp. MLS_C]
MKRKPAVLLLSLIACTGCGDGTDDQYGSGAGPGAIELAITDTVGVELGDSCYVFGYLADAARTDSIIYALDMSRSQLRKYTPDGEWAGFIGGRGDGPGELVMPHWLALLPDGSILIQDITDLGLYSPDGGWTGHVLTHSGNWPSMHTPLGNGTFAISWHEFLREPEHILRRFIASYDLQGAKITEYLADSIRVPAPPEENTDAINRFLFSHYMAGDLDGNLYIVTRHSPDYRIVCYGPDASPFDTLSLDVPVVERTAEEIGLVKRYTEEYLRGMGTSNVMEWVYEPDPFKPPISGIWLGWGGNLWVLRGNTEVPEFDVWSVPEGELLYTARLDLELPPTQFLTFYIAPWCRDFLAVHEDESMVQRLLLIDASYPEGD